jgi:hypothetical protein
LTPVREITVGKKKKKWKQTRRKMAHRNQERAGDERYMRDDRADRERLTSRYLSTRLVLVFLNSLSELSFSPPFLQYLSAVVSYLQLGSAIYRS